MNGWAIRVFQKVRSRATIIKYATQTKATRAVPLIVAGQLRVTLIKCVRVVKAKGRVRAIVVHLVVVIRFVSPMKLLERVLLIVVAVQVVVPSIHLAATLPSNGRAMVHIVRLDVILMPTDARQAVC